MSFKDISCVELRWHLCSAERNHLSKLVEYEIIFILGPLIKMSFKDISYLELGQPLLAKRNHLGRRHHEK